MNKLEAVKSELTVRIIEAFNSKFFDSVELVRIQDAIEDSEDLDTVNNEMMSHHLRVIGSFQVQMVDDLANQMKAINPDSNRTIN